MITTINKYRKHFENSNVLQYTDQEKQELEIISNNSRFGGNPKFSAPNTYHFIFNIGDSMTANYEDCFLVKTEFGVDLYMEEPETSAEPMESFSSVSEFISNWVLSDEDENDSDFDDDDNDLDPAGGRGLHSHESRKIFEGGSDGDFEHNQDQIELASKLYDEGQVLFNQGNIEAAEQKRQEALKVGSWLSWTDTELPPYDKSIATNENCSNDPLCLAFQAKNIECSVSPKGEIIVTVSFPLGDTDYWFEPLDTTMTPKSKGIYTCTSASHVNIGEGTDVEPNVFKGDVEQAVQFISHNLAQAKAAFDEIPKTTMTPSEPEKPGPKVVGKIDLKDDGKQRFKHKNETMITKIEDFKNKIIKEGAVKRHWEEINNAIEAKLPLKYKSGENFGEAIPTEYYNNVVTFDNGINVIDMYVQTQVNNINESLTTELPESCEVLTAEMLDIYAEYISFHSEEELEQIRQLLSNNETLYLCTTYTDDDYEGFDGADDYFDSNGHSWDAIQVLQNSNGQLDIISEFDNHEGTYYSIIGKRTDTSIRSH